MTDTTSDATIVAEIQSPVEVLLERDEERWTLVMRRSFRHTAERLWQMITDPAELKRWSPVVPDRPLTEPGPATCRENPGDDPIDAEVLVVNAPRLLVHRWGTDLLRWTVTPDGNGAVLELRQTFADHAMASSYAAGWQVCLGCLAATADGISRERVTGQRALAYGWRELHDRYAMELATTSTSE